MADHARPSRRSPAPRGASRRKPAASSTPRTGARVRNAAATQSSRSRRGKDGDARVRALAVEAARLLNDSHLAEVLLLDVRGLSSIQDYVLIGTGASDRQIRSVADDVARLAAEQGLVRLGTEADRSSNWVVVDLVDIVVHLFEPATRAHYDLEMMWGDAPRVTWRRRGPAAKRTKTKPVADDDAE